MTLSELRNALNYIGVDLMMGLSDLDPVVQKQKTEDLKLITDFCILLDEYQKSAEPFVIATQPGAGAPIDKAVWCEALLCGCSPEAHALNELRKSGVKVILINTMTADEQAAANKNFPANKIDVEGLPILNDPRGLLKELLQTPLMKTPYPTRDVYPPKAMIFALSHKGNGIHAWELADQIKNPLAKPSRKPEDYLELIRERLKVAKTLYKPGLTHVGQIVMTNEIYDSSQHSLREDRFKVQNTINKTATGISRRKK